MSKMTISEIQEINSRIEYVRSEYWKNVLWCNQEGIVTFEKMVEFLRDEDNRYNMEMMIELAEKLEE